ncbi:phosphate ABC transporter permease subunit PstC [Nocardioides coralli]|uniref:phosphate ABC transporter permease subunit PstC n=1 Tax=Nocardioides coralli TaxID=2872154 RepID=UPI0020183209|nr:phosphate ABC transporter permease subunit PstC [Nocardioides coralli]
MIKAVLFVAAMISILTTIGIVVTLLRPSLDFFAEASIIDFLIGTDWAPRRGEFGAVPLVKATFLITLIALLVSVPVGLGAAMYLSEYASARTRKIFKPVLELLAGVPSVVYGFFALTVITPWLLQDLLALDVGFTNALAAGLVLGVMIVPTVASLSEDAMSAVPLALRQGSLAMGANKMQTTLRVVFPAALSGIAAAIVLGLSRAVGETMIVTLASGSLPNMSADPRDGMQAMTGYMATTAGGENPVGSLEYNTLFAIGLLLFAITLVINMVSISLVRRFRQEY